MHWSYSGLLAAVLVAVPTVGHAGCTLLHASDAQPPAGMQPSPAQSLNEDFPANPPSTYAAPPWLQADFKKDPQKYADTIRALAKATIKIQAGKIQIDKQTWWTVPF